MDIEALRQYCLSKKAVTECFPFDETTLVFKVVDRMFLLVDLEHPDCVSMKCNPDYAIELREHYNPLTGEASGARNFGWTASHLLQLMLQPY